MERSLPRVMTVKQLAAFLHVRPATIYQLVHNHGLPGFKLGADWRFMTENVLRWLHKSSKARAV